MARDSGNRGGGVSYEGERRLWVTVGRAGMFHMTG